MTGDELRAALADDLESLVRLHDRELNAGLLDDVLSAGFPDGMALLPDEPVRDAMRTALAHLANSRKTATAAAEDPLVWLAADYAAIYLNGACGASPYESVWVTDEHLTCQAPMFEMRQLYEQAGLAVDDWRKRYDDHFVLQFQFLANRLRNSSVELGWIGRCIDEHVGYWYGDFAEAVVKRADTDFYRALAALTADWLMGFRDLIEQVTGEPRTPREAMADRVKKKIALAAGELAPVKFVPGGRPDAGPSW